MESEYLCPNCGEPLDSQFIKAQFNCLHCGEALLFSDDYKVTLAKPLQTYLTLGESTQDNWEEGFSEDQGSNPIPQRSAQRTRMASQLALERIANEQSDVRRGILSGIFFIVFGILIILVAFLRQSFISADWLNLVGFAFGVVFVPLGIYFSIWFYRSAQSLSRDEAEISEELIKSG